MFHSDQTCWVDQLDPAARAQTLEVFDAELRTSSRFTDAWRTVQFEGRFPFRELLDPAKFPDGARLCYPPGTDERVDPS